MKKRKNRGHFVVFTLLFATYTSFAQPSTQPNLTTISIDSIQSYIKRLASEEFEGRAPGTKGGVLAATFIQQKFSTYGLTPFESAPTFLQPFTVTTALKAGENNRISLRLKRQFNAGTDFLPLSSSSNDKVESNKIVFVGYGISTKNYDDYDALDVHGKIVVMMRYSPDGENPHSDFQEQTTIWKKLSTAKEKGAIGVLLFTGEANGSDNLLDLTRDKLASDAGIPAMNITRALAAQVLMMKPQFLSQIQHKIDSLKKPNSFQLNHQVSFQTEVLRVKAETHNIIGYIPSTDPAYKNEFIVIGAHYDHLGFGGQGSGSLAPNDLQIHYGADDNASGTAGLLELARHFSVERTTIKRNIVFIAFGAEEMGLLGSGYFVNHPLFPLEQIAIMLNMDMIGRMKDSSLAISGVGTAKELEELCKSENSNEFRLKLSQDGFGPSDHSSFYAKNIPVLFFFTGNHTNYHKPTDTWEKINYTDETRILNFISKLVKKIDISTRPTYTKAQAEASTRSSMSSFKVSFGSIPNYSEEVDGVLLDGVREGSVAEKAGLKSGDIIRKLADKPIRNIYDYTEAIKSISPGDVIVVVIKRGENVLTLNAEFPLKK